MSTTTPTRRRVIIADEHEDKTPQGPTSSKCSPDIIRKFCKYIAEGLPADAVCDLLGINNTTYYTWKIKGERFLDGDGQPPGDAIYGHFLLEFRKATAEYRLGRVRSLHKKGNAHWVRDLAILERRDRKSFGRHTPDGGDEEAFQKDEKFL